jgi:glycosyltransferase involved in cell wall biosynthesis
MNTCVFTCVFPSVEPYLDDFLLSLSKQTMQEFRLVVVNDGYFNLRSVLKRYAFKKVTIIEGGSSPSLNRKKGIEECLAQNAEVIIFADSDDTFSENRFELSCNVIESGNIDVVVNDINICDSDQNIILGNYFSHRFYNRMDLEFDNIKLGNFFGLSNTAVRSTILKKFKIPTLDPFDWTFFSNLLLLNSRAVFLSEITTHYRQHDSNFVGMGGGFSIEKLMRALDVKVQHYKALTYLSDDIATLARDFYELRKFLDTSQKIETYYSECIIHQYKFPLWWEEAVLLGDI